MSSHTTPMPRAVRGPSPWTSRVMRVAAVRPEIAGVRTIDLEFRDVGVDYAFLPGQFNMLALPGIGECAISIAAHPADWAPATRVPSGTSAAAVAPPCGSNPVPPSERRDAIPGETRRLRHTFRAVGNVTRPLARLAVGDEVILRGPFGSPWPLAELQGRDVIIAAGGLGLASMRSAILHIAHHRRAYGAVTILHGAKTPPDLLYTAEYDAWRSAGLDVLTIVDRADAGGSGGHDAGAPVAATAVPWAGRVGFVPALFEAVDMAARRTSVLCCGPEPMMAAVVARARAAGIASDAMWLSLERNMACAAGFCGLCQFGPAFVCKDGPVFRHDSIARFLAVRHL